MTEPWKDPENYKSGKPAKCLGCGEACVKTHWGKWCYGCNVARIERINRAFEELTNDSIKASS